MKQYLKLLEKIESHGTIKPAAREGMPSTKSLFGYQFRHDLNTGFPLLTTKEVNFKNIVIELLWFLRGDTNIKYLVDNGVNIWNEDAYNYYLKIVGKPEISIEEFINRIKTSNIDNLPGVSELGYKYGDCGFQYGKVWRSWEDPSKGFNHNEEYPVIDQIKNLIKSLINTPESRRHILTSIDPSHDSDLALYWCHALSQFNCRPLPLNKRLEIYESDGSMIMIDGQNVEEQYEKFLDEQKIPKYYLDCQMYQRSADVFLGVPYNIASYALLTHIIAKVCKMVPGDFIHTFGDVHIYENHLEQVSEQLEREHYKLPTLEIVDEGNDWAYIRNFFDFSMLNTSDFILKDYKHHPKIKGKLSTGLK